MTILVITHRLSTVRRADVIDVLEQGRLVESGPWDVLLAKEDGRFRALCRAQGVGSQGLCSYWWPRSASQWVDAHGS
jgi:ABC-type multidrug transport system fused ATPase/permease subunit